MAGDNDVMRLLSFLYKDSKGNVTERTLIHWKETSIYIQGRCSADAFYRTFRKDRVIEYLQGAERLSFERAPAPPPFSPSLPKDMRGQILFTGFKQDERIVLEGLAALHGLKVVKTPTKNLGFLCAGYNAGWAKVRAAVEVGAFILSETQLRTMFETGDISS
jgi:hypothetical protein